MFRHGLAVHGDRRITMPSNGVAASIIGFRLCREGRDGTDVLMFRSPAPWENRRFTHIADIAHSLIPLSPELKVQIGEGAGDMQRQRARFITSCQAGVPFSSSK